MDKADKGAGGAEEDEGDDGAEESEGADRTDVATIYILGSVEKSKNARNLIG